MRRVHLVPFDAEFTGTKEDKTLEERLKTEAPAIMALFVQACLEWQSMGLAAPERVTRATLQLFEELDPIGRFAAERLTDDPTGFLSTDELCSAFGSFLHDNDYEPVIDPQKLIRRLKELPGVKAINAGAGRRSAAERSVRTQTHRDMTRRFYSRKCQAGLTPIYRSSITVPDAFVVDGPAHRLCADRCGLALVYAELRCCYRHQEGIACDS